MVQGQPGSWPRRLSPARPPVLPPAALVNFAGSTVSHSEFRCLMWYIYFLTFIQVISVLRLRYVNVLMSVSVIT